MISFHNVTNSIKQKYKFQQYFSKRPGIPKLKTRVKHNDIIFRVTNSNVFYLVNYTELIRRDDSMI